VPAAAARRAAKAPGTVKTRPLATPKVPAVDKANVTAEYEQALKDRKKQKYVLRLYVAGNNLRSQIAVENVKKICEEYLKGRYELEVVDIYQDQTKNPVDLVLAAPTLVKKLPLPLRKVVGDMTRKEKVLVGLDLLARS